MKGSCLCGAVNFVISTKITGLYQCHCQLCQKQSGSTSNTATIVKDRYFEWLTGEDSISKWKKTSGFTSDFCKTCGCPVPNRLRDTPYYWIPMGLIDSDEQSSFEEVKISSHICCHSKALWDRLPESGTHYDDMPDDLDSFISMLSE
ncbi:MAG: GFA family protein [Gammaproteobacteria bacterium]|nr:GFA family protein [Gammaproteobacteria bacterium]